MKRIIASVGLVALGAASVQAQSVITATPNKWWNVQATVRGFYDDNLNSEEHPTHDDRVWGFEVSPKIGVVFGNEQTTFTADYKYAFLYYDHTPFGDANKFDQDHFFTAALTHAFSERYRLRLRDSFVLGQEPDALRTSAAFHTPFRISGNNIVNSGGITFNAELTPLLGVEVGYDNAWYSYANKISFPANQDANGNVIPSVSGALDRIDQAPHISALWHVLPDTTASLSYQFEDVDYTATGQNSLIGGPIGGPNAVSSDRNVRSHTVYLGLDHQFRQDFYGSVQAGAAYYDYYNLHNTAFGPYARLALTYVYAQESSIQAGFQEGRTATDVVGGGTSRADLVHDVEASTIFASVHQRIFANLFANLNGSFQHSTFNGGGAGFDGKSEDFYEFGANLEYVFNANLSAHVGYDFDRLDSDIPGRTYDRNKVYIGATASY